MTPSPATTDAPWPTRLAALGLHEADFEESFARSAGPGGQNVNKTSTCVILRHLPTGLQVRCQDTRQQARNRELARQRLLDLIQSQQQRRADAQRALAEKLRRQKRPRSRAAKERILADKSRRATRKAARRPVDAD